MPLLVGPDTFVGVRLAQVLRNENPSLWVPYWRQRERIRRECAGRLLPDAFVHTGLCEEFCQTAGHASLCNDAREVYLFHGTKPSAANAICSSEFWHSQSLRVLQAPAQQCSNKVLTQTTRAPGFDTDHTLMATAAVSQQGEVLG